MFNKHLFRYPTNLLLPLPFAYWIGEVAIAGYLIFVVFCSIIVRLQTNNLKSNNLVVGVTFFTAFYVLISVAYFKGVCADWVAFGPHDQTFLLLQAIQFFLFIIIAGLVGPIDRKQYTQYITYIFVLLLATTFIESFAVNVLHVASSNFPAYRESWVYNQKVIGNYYRPFGLTGSAPINASIMVVMMWLYIGLKEKRGVAAFKIHVLTILALLVNYSGQGLLTYVITVILYQFRFRIKNLILVGSFCVGMHIILSKGFLGWKITYVYFVRVLKHFNFNEIISVLPLKYLLFGALGNMASFGKMTIEFYLLHSVSRFGIILTMFMWILILGHRAENRAIKMGLWAAFFGSLHYASILIVILQVPLALLLVNWIYIYRSDLNVKTVKYFKEYSLDNV